MGEVHELGKRLEMARSASVQILPGGAESSFKFFVQKP
jgi:hypothetical protein